MKATVYNIVFMLVTLSATLVGCRSEDFPDIGSNGKKVAVRFSIEASEMATNFLTTRSQATEAESKIDNVYLLIYHDSKSVPAQDMLVDDTVHYFASLDDFNNGASFELAPGNYIAYAFANVNNSFKSVNGDNSEDPFTTAYASPRSNLLDNAVSYVPQGSGFTMDSFKSSMEMSGSVEFTVVENVSSGQRMEMHRLVSKHVVKAVKFENSNPSGIVVTDISLHNTPRQSYYVPHPLSTEDDIDDADEAASDAKGAVGNMARFEDTSPLTWDGASDLTFYMYENRQGLKVVSDQKDKNFNIAPQDAAYLTITGYSNNFGRLTWNIYLGGNITSNFNVKRNKSYIYEITLGEDDQDVRIVQDWYIAPSGTWAGSNIYWNGTNLTFDVNYDPASPHWNYQGVYFRWGSLVGISSASGGGQFWTGTQVYWMNAAGSMATDATDPETPWALNYGGNDPFRVTLPYLDDMTITNASDPIYNDNVVIQPNDRFQVFQRGDICYWLGRLGYAPNGYRLPTTNAAVGDIPIQTSWLPANLADLQQPERAGEDGGTTALQKNAFTFYPQASTYPYKETKFPASGMRVNEIVAPGDENGSVVYVGQKALYWTADGANGTGDAALFGIEIDNFGTLQIYSPTNVFKQERRYNAYPIRCVKK
ncbi:MAG: DUF4906 domain-containing protein [Mediterranea sp.]|jgi:hypothetical protein|nr:DUF4906 domain-containing protein [Mediterranea sp.]